MQSVLIEKPYKFVPPFRARWPQSWFVRLGLHHSTLRKKQGIIEHECRGLDRLRESIAAGHGVMLTPNHPRTTDPMLFCYVAKETPCNFYAMASWHLFNQDWLTTFTIRLMGGFSVNREGLDRQSVDEAIRILQTAERPLLIFPEGTTSRTNDKLMALMEGPAFIARTAAKRRAKNDGGKVVVHPIGIKYFFNGDIEASCNAVLTDIEHKLSWRPSPEMPLIDRLVKVGDALLSLKEMQYACETQPGRTLRQRQTNMVNHLLEPLEREWIGKTSDNGIALRIKSLRMKIFPEMSRAEIAPEERARRWKQLEDTYLAQQIDCYPENYVVDLPSVDRILETCEKFEEDLTDACRVHGNLKAVIEVDDAIEVSPKRVRGAETDPLIEKIRERLEEKLGVLQHESRMYSPVASVSASQE